MSTAALDHPVDLLILGLGNVLCADDGLGVAAVQRIERDYIVPAGVRVADGGTLGLALLPELQDARVALLVDAIGADGPPGTLVRLEGDEVTRAAAQRMSVHQVGVADLLHAARLLGDGPESIVLLGLVPDSIELDLDRTPAVEAQIPALVAAVVEETRRLGYVLVLKERDEDEPDATPRARARAGADADVGL